MIYKGYVIFYFMVILAKIAIINKKGYFMQTISASKIKQNSTLLQNALREDLLITKRDKPFVVVMDYKKYQELINPSKKQNQQDWMDETFGVMDEKESDALLETIYSSKVNKDFDI